MKRFYLNRNINDSTIKSYRSAIVKYVCFHGMSMGSLMDEAIVFNDDVTPEQKQDAINAMKQVTEIDQGQQLNETPDVSSSSGDGYSELGKVYKDPKTGKLIMIEN